MSSSIHLGKLDWPGARLKNGKAITIAESSGPSSISRLRMAIHLNKAVPFRDGMIAEWGESFEDDEWKMHSIPPKGHILTPEESVIPAEVLVLAKWLQNRFDCSGGVWLRVDADMPRFVEMKLNKPHNISAAELYSPTEFILNLCQEVREHFPG